MYHKNKQANVKIHNLSNVKLPEAVLLTLSLGLKFNFINKPSVNNIMKNVKEGCRKMAWKVFFNNKDNGEDDKLTNLIIKIKKSVGTKKINCPLENVLFSEQFSLKCRRDLQQNVNKPDPLHEYLIGELNEFISRENVIIKQSDKNAGLVVMKKQDYQNEIFRQLHDENTYIPSTLAHFDREMDNFIDKAKHANKIIFCNFKVKFNSLIPDNYSPANFYVLPKMHKKFEVFPLGRPICSNVKTINRGYSILLDSLLKPLCTCIPTLIIDTPHLLMLLNNLTLQPNRKYCLIAADIQSMYQELPIQVCKESCMSYYELHNNEVKIPIKINLSQLKTLLHLALDYSFTKHENELFFQKRGIQMGNNASVAIANITAEVELQSLWRPEMVFKGRFIDDILCIVDVTDFTVNIEEWISNTFQHPFLKFTTEHSFSSINFLDLNIQINKNNGISTSLYQKEMSRHEYLHYDSCHPRHMLNSLPYSCGLRVIRACSEVKDRELKLEEMFKKFLRRQYPELLVRQTREKLFKLNRADLISPKSALHLEHFQMHNIVNIPRPTLSSIVTDPLLSKQVFIILPYHIFPVRKIVQNNIFAELNKCRSNKLKALALQLKLKYAFTIPSQTHAILTSIENKKKE